LNKNETHSGKFNDLTKQDFSNWLGHPDEHWQMENLMRRDTRS